MAMLCIGPPVFEVDSHQFSHPTTRPAEIKLSIVGTAPIDVRLFKVGDDGETSEITTDMYPRFSITFAGSLFRLNISDLRVADGGTYRVTATNPVDTSHLDIVLDPVGEL